MRQIRITDTATVPNTVAVRDSPPPARPYVNLYTSSEGMWSAQHWFRVNNQWVSSQPTARSTKAEAVDDALRIAHGEEIPFVRRLREEQDAMYVESTIVE